MSLARTTSRARLTVRVTPRGGRDAVDGVGDDGVLRVRVAAAPADGRANHAVVRVVARALDVPPSRVRIASGASARTKVIEVDGMAPDELARRLAALHPAGKSKR